MMIGLGSAARVTVVVVSLYVPPHQKMRHRGAARPPPRCLLSQRADTVHALSALVDLLLGLLLLPLAESGIGSGTGEPVILDLLPDLGAILDLLG